MTHTNRTGLYIMMIVTMLTSGSTQNRTIDMEKKINGLEKSINEVVKSTDLPLREENGQKFYEINGQRAYVEIDGRSAFSYSTNYDKKGQVGGKIK